MSLFRKKSSDPEETFTLLISAAKGDPELAKTLLAILSQPDFHRKSALNSLLSNMRLSGAPSNLTAAVAVLLDDEAAKKAEAYLKGEIG